MLLVLLGRYKIHFRFSRVADGVFQIHAVGIFTRIADQKHFPILRDGTVVKDDAIILLHGVAVYDAKLQLSKAAQRSGNLEIGRFALDRRYGNSAYLFGRVRYVLRPAKLYVNRSVRLIRNNLSFDAARTLFKAVKSIILLLVRNVDKGKRVVHFIIFIGDQIHDRRAVTVVIVLRKGHSGSAVGSRPTRRKRFNIDLCLLLIGNAFEYDVGGFPRKHKRIGAAAFRIVDDLVRFFLRDLKTGRRALLHIHTRRTV